MTNCKHDSRIAWFIRIIVWDRIICGWTWVQIYVTTYAAFCHRVGHIFIDFVAEIFGPLFCGFPLLVVPYPVRRNLILLRDFIDNHGAIRIKLVPTLARLVVKATNATPCAGSALHRSQQTPRRCRYILLWQRSTLGPIKRCIAMRGCRSPPLAC